MPKLWSDTIETHRHDVREAILDAAGRLSTSEGLLAVTMSRVAAEAGIARATLYKYYPDAETILHAWHERHVEAHLTRLNELASTNKTPGARLKAVLDEYARIRHSRSQHGTPELGALLHRSEAMAGPEQRLLQLFHDVISEGAESGEIRNDVAPDELATYCLHAIAAAGSAGTPAALSRVVGMTLTALTSHDRAAAGTSRRRDR